MSLWSICLMTRRALVAAAFAGPLCFGLSASVAQTAVPPRAAAAPSRAAAVQQGPRVPGQIGKPQSLTAPIAKPGATGNKCLHCGCQLDSCTVCTDCSNKLDNQGKPVMASNDMRGTGFVYTLDNDPQRNGVAVFRRHVNGSLVPLAGSPFNAGGKGLSGGDIDEQGAVRVHGKYVLAVNPGSDTIAVMEKSSRGLLHVEGSPFPSGGSTPLSLALHGDLVYVANQAAEFAGPKSEPNITGFRLMPDGRLVPLPNSMQTFPKGQGPAQVEFSPNGKVLVASAGFQAEDASRLYSFRVAGDGRLTMGAGSPIKPEGAHGTVGFSFDAQSDRVYVSVFSHSAVIPFAVDPMTAAIRQSGEPIGDEQRAACWTAISPDGRTLYVANFVSNSISVYDLTEGKPTLLGSIPRRGASDKDTKDLEVSKDGKFLYAVGSGKRQISVFRIESNRLLTELPMGQSPVMLATGQNVTGLATD